MLTRINTRPNLGRDKTSWRPKSRSIDEARAYEHEVFLALKEALPEARVSWSTGVPIGSHTCRELSVTSRTDMKVVLPGERRVAFEVVRVPEN